jgi:protein-S-isoprenylcysteine O-methyltransferase Ste14
MLHNLFCTQITSGRALDWAEWLWLLLALVWFALSFTIKSAKRTETIVERFQHVVPLLLSFWLLFAPNRYLLWLNFRLWPDSPLFWWTGLVITAAGVGISIWARLSLGTNWSGMVTLKDNHELIRTGLYSRIRHPIYTGIFFAAIGVGVIQGQLRCLLGVLILLVTFHFKAKREEGFLYQEFGPSFVEHHRRTGMFLPKRIM